jgi:two-component system alkaline phosphatase synthesis response regulator PhoP
MDKRKEPKQRILLVEDEESLVDLIRMNLNLEGYDVSVARTGVEALKLARSARFDLCILDIMLPELDGFAVCKTLRFEKNRTPILFLSAKSTAADRVEGLKIGGDDYLTKPFDLEELLLRIANLIRLHQRTNEGDLETFSFGNNRINFSTYEVKCSKGEKRTLSKREIQLLKFLIERKNQVVSREEILESVWGYDVYPSTRTIDNYILAFRKYFESGKDSPLYFQSIRGVGYKFVG